MAPRQSVSGAVDLFVTVQTTVPPFCPGLPLCQTCVAPVLPWVSFSSAMMASPLSRSCSRSHVKNKGGAQARLRSQSQACLHRGKACGFGAAGGASDGGDPLVVLCRGV